MSDLGPPPTELPRGTVEQQYKPDVPNFMRLGSVPVNYLQQVETDLLEPVVFQDGNGSSVDGFVRFQVQPKGFLHSHSKIFMSLVPPAAATRVIYPANVGVGSVVKKAVLKIGNKVLNEISDWDHLHAFHSTKISNENNVERELYTTGRYMNQKYNFDNGAGSKIVAAGVSLQTSRDPVTDYDESVQCNLEPVAVMEGANPAESPSYAIDLSDLFPFLKVHQLPLYMIQEPVTIELTLRPPVAHRVVRVDPAAAGSSQNLSYAIDQTELKMCADYVFYGATDEMERYAEANKVLTFPFVDYRATSTSTTSAALQSDTVRNLGMASRLVSKVITMFNADRKGEDDLFLQLASLSTATSASKGVEPIRFNVRYNDKFEFSSNITNTARLFSLLQQAEGMAFVSRDQYSSQGGGYEAGDGGTHTFEGINQTSIAGKFFYTSVKLTGGRVGSRGIELHIQSDGWRSGLTTMRSFCEYMRSASLEGGRVAVFNL